MSELELEEYNLLIEEQAYPFEEKGIKIHKKNIELLNSGVYSLWIDKSLKKLGELVPGSYAKYEFSTGVVTSLMFYRYELGDLSEIAAVEAKAETEKPSKSANKAPEKDMELESK